MTDYRQTYCNPLPLADYPRGRLSIEPPADPSGWVLGQPRDFRETADPSVIFHEGKWYLYPSAGMAYVSDDFLTWRHHPIDPYDCGYAPTVVQHAGRFLLTACQASLYEADNPLGPFHEIGPMLDAAGKPIDDWADPMLFADDDGRLYAYWGLGGDGIKGVELDAETPNVAITPRQVLFKFDPAHTWERYGEHNEDASKSYIEGPWMLKAGGRYYLTYAGPGTEFSTYAMGCYVGDGPLGPFTYQQRNPICADRSGLVRGPGHGCITRGPNDTLWAFYTCIVRTWHSFERRVGMDPAGIDENGELFVLAASESPQWAPGERPTPADGNDAGLLPVNHWKSASASSHSPGRTPDYAVDGYHRTWWQPAEGDSLPTLTCRFVGSFDVAAARVIWAEPGLDYSGGAAPTPARYRIEVSPDDAGDTWQTVVDRMDSDADMLIDYRTFAPTAARRARLSFSPDDVPLQRGVIDFSLFGRSVATAQQ